MTDTAFGPADHPDLPLGLRRHPRYALRNVMDGDDGMEIVTIYVHTLVEARIVSDAINANGLQIERWDEDRREWVETQL